MKKRTGVKNAVWALTLVALLLGGCGSKADRSSDAPAAMMMTEEAAYDAAAPTCLTIFTALILRKMK